MSRAFVLPAFVLALAVTIFSSTSLFSAAPAKLPPGCVGLSSCECCHPEVVKAVSKGAMGRLFMKHPRSTREELVCESCHGPGQVHADSDGKEFGEMIRFGKGGATPALKKNEACIVCHQKKQQLFWTGSTHELRDVSCSDCHVIHQSEASELVNPKMIAGATQMDLCNKCHKQQVSQQMRFSHHPLREGKMKCSSCHNVHGTPAEKLIKGNSVPELCFSCHAEIRGPHLFEHPPVQENCSNCHSAHGSNYPRLMKQPELRSCRQCHTNFHQGGQLGLGKSPRRAAANVVGRLCTDCHSRIHGSNHPNGFFLTR